MWALLSLAVGSFGIGMTEFVVMGLLPEHRAGPAADCRGRPTRSGHRADRLAHLASTRSASSSAHRRSRGSVAKYPRHRVMVGLALALTVFNALDLHRCPRFELVAASRFLAGLPHGAYFGIGALVAADVLGPGKRAKGVAFVLAGPHRSRTSSAFRSAPTSDSRSAGASRSSSSPAIFAAATVCIALLRARACRATPARTFRAELRVFRIGQVWLTLGVGAIGFGGFFAVYSYVAPMVTEVAGSPAMGRADRARR